jgi:heavy metal sensor kinase
MFFEKINRFRRSLAFRLTILYMGIFTILIFAAFYVFYQAMISRINARTDNDMEVEMKECTLILASKGIDGLKDHIDNEIKSVGINDSFFRLVTTAGEEILSSDSGDQWKELDINRNILTNLTGNSPVFQTIKLRRLKHSVRVIYEIVAPEKVLQIGHSLEDDERIFSDLKVLFRILIPVFIILTSFGGWFMAKRSLSSIEQVTQTAMAIADGAMGKRVPLTGSGDEIDRLSATFNNMLERIQSLIAEMKEVTDNIAHDLRSPIARIRGLAEVTLISEKNMETYQAMAESTVEECDRLLRMINMMLEISETEAGVSTLNRSAVDVSELIEEACDLYQPLAEDRGIHIEVNMPAQFHLSGDKSKLQRVLSNLLDNAIKYTTSGGEIIVSAEEVDKKVMISVHDTGIGISRNEISRIFERFYRADKSRSVPGAGLGLSLVQAIVRSHGGEIKVSSSLGSGSTFTVSFPLVIPSSYQIVKG